MTTRRAQSMRLLLTLSYAGLLVIAGIVVFAGIYLVMRFFPSYPLTQADPADTGRAAPSRGDVLFVVQTIGFLTIAVLTVIGLVGGWFLAGWMLRPLDSLVSAADRVSRGDYSYRLRFRGRRTEFHDVADAFNVMIERVTESAAEHERFAANAAHELRTPLSISATVLDVATRSTTTDWAVVADKLTAANRRASGIVDALLRIADTGEADVIRRPCDIGQVVLLAVGEWEARAAERGIGIDARLGSVPVIADPDLVMIAVRNLVENAIRHNHDGGFVTIHTVEDIDHIGIRIQNSGERHTDEAAGTLVEPFLRGAARVAGHGHGLGLTLVHTVVKRHGGALNIRPRAEGGLEIDLLLPRGEHGRTHTTIDRAEREPFAL